jgi:hypothetical protein
MLFGFFRNFWVSLIILFRKSYDDRDIAEYWQKKNWFRVKLDVSSLILLVGAGFLVGMVISSVLWMMNYKAADQNNPPDFTSNYIFNAFFVCVVIYFVSMHLRNYRVLRQFMYQGERLRTVALESDANTIEILEKQLRTLWKEKDDFQAEKQREVEELESSLAQVRQEKQSLEVELKDADAAHKQAASSLDTINNVADERAKEIEHLRAKTMREALQTAEPTVITEELRQRLLKLRRSAPKSEAAQAQASQYLAWIINTAHEVFPDELTRFRDLSYVSEEAKRIAQYDSILSLYSDKIAKLRAREMNEEDREEAIYAMKRLRDKEIELLENAEVKVG